MSELKPASTGSAWLLCGLLAVSIAAIGGWLWMRPVPMAADEAARGSATATTGNPTAPDVLAGWPAPAVALVLTGEMHGYIEPCGCTEGQTGGLARRATLMRELREDRGWPVIGLDLGGTMQADRVGRQQTRMKFQMARDSLESMGYLALGLGYEETRPRQDELLEISDRDKAIPEYDLRLVSANVLPYPDTPELEISLPYRMIEVPAGKAGGRSLRIGVTSILGATLSQGIASDLFLKVRPPAEAIADVLPKMQAEKPDLLVLLSHAKSDESAKLAEQFPAFQLVVSVGGPEDGQIKPRLIGQTRFLQVGQKGKNVGVIGFYPHQPEPFRYELVKLDGDRFANAPEIDDLMQVYQDRLRDERPDLRDNARPSTHPSGRTFVGAETCGECHSASYEKWLTTGHARAFEGLTTGRSTHKGRWIDRKWDAECIACHAVGWDPQQALRWESGFVDEMTTPHLLGNQCENCHGPGSRHVELENSGDASEQEIAAERKAMWLSKETAASKTCRQCHDGDNDPHFDFEKYWPEIEHPEK